jgi:predicted MFS family arabinose efflux permease
MPGLLSLALASCLAVTTEVLPVGLLPDIGATFGVSDSVTGLLVSLYAVMVAALAVPLTVATSRFARKPLLLTTLLCYALSNAVVAAAPAFTVLAIGRTVGGITHALFFSLVIGYAPRLVSRADVGRALAVSASGASTGMVLGVPLSTSLGTAAGWRAPFAVLAVLSVLAFVLVRRLLPRYPGRISLLFLGNSRCTPLSACCCCPAASARFSSARFFSGAEPAACSPCGGSAGTSTEAHDERP